MAADEDIRTPSRAQPEPRSKTVPREAKARDRARIVHWTPKRRRFASPRPGTSAATRFPDKPDTPRSSEPILIPKLRIQFADFPYLHYSIDFLIGVKITRFSIFSFFRHIAIFFLAAKTFRDRATRIVKNDLFLDEQEGYEVLL
jgi:hypothetical protein